MEGLGVERPNVEGLNVEGLYVERKELGVGEAWISDRHRGLSFAIVLYALNSVGRPLRRSAFLSVRPQVICEHSIVRGCATHPVSSCRDARLMSMIAMWFSRV